MSMTLASGVAKAPVMTATLRPAERAIAEIFIESSYLKSPRFWRQRGS
jgi:hypothetical protein